MKLGKYALLKAFAGGKTIEQITAIVEPTDSVHRVVLDIDVDIPSEQILLLAKKAVERIMGQQTEDVHNET